MRITDRAVEELDRILKKKRSKTMESKARMMYQKYPKLFMQMYLHSLDVDAEHPDDNSVIYSKLMANAMGKAEPFWTPEGTDMEPVYEDFRKLGPEEEK